MIHNTNQLHKLFYIENGYRDFPKTGIVPLSTVKSAATWLRNNKTKKDGNKN